MYALALSRLLHSQTGYIERLNLFTHEDNFVLGNSIVRTRPQNHEWGHCGETSAYKTTGILPVFEWVWYFDVINKTMQQSWRYASVQSHVITQAGYLGHGFTVIALE